MSKQQDIETMPLVLANKIKRWDYDLSVTKMRPVVRQWKKATIEMLRELYLAREFLTGQKGQHKDPEADDYIIHTWSGYCGEIGLSYQTANNWLRPFKPRELSDTGKDVLLLESPIKTETINSRVISESRIANVLSTGERPTDWTNREEQEVRRRLENARYAELAEKYDVPAVPKIKTDYFADSIKLSKDVVNFKLEQGYQTLAQLKVFNHIEQYFETFDDPSTKVNAAFNMALKMKNLANEIADFYFKLKGADSKEGQNES